MIEAVDYSRYSSAMQREESIVAQQSANSKHCLEKGYVLVKRYADEAMTGRNMNRPQLQQLLLDARQGKFKVVVVHKLDRLSRDVLDMLKIRQELGKCGVRIESVIENYDDSPEGQLFQHFQMGLNEYYSRNLGREVMKGTLTNAELRKHNGGKPPLGYRVNPETKRYEINEEEAPIVRIIFEKFLDNWTYSEIAQYLNLQGYKTRTGASFSSKSAFYDILVNPKFKGQYTYNRTSRKDPYTKRNHRKSKDESEIVRIDGGMPAIVSEEMFDKVQERLKSRVRTKGELSAKTPYLLSSLLVCEQCGGKFHADNRPSGRNKTPYMTYRCSNRKAVGDRKCRCKEIKRDEIESFVLGQIEGILLNPANIDYFMECLNQQLSNRQSQSKLDKPRVKKRLTEVTNQINQLVEVLTKLGEGQSLESIVEKLKQLEFDKKQLEHELEVIEEKIAGFQINKTSVKKMFKDLRGQLHTENARHVREIIRLLIKEIIVGDETIEIIFNLNSLFCLQIKTICTFQQRYLRAWIENRYMEGIDSNSKSIPSLLKCSL